MTDIGLLELAESVSALVEEITTGKVQPYSEDVQKRAMEAFSRLDLPGYSNSQLADAVQTCLVDVLSCDNASWDTPPGAFEENREALQSLIDVGS